MMNSMQVHHVVSRVVKDIFSCRRGIIFGVRRARIETARREWNLKKKKNPERLYNCIVDTYIRGWLAQLWTPIDAKVPTEG